MPGKQKIMKDCFGSRVRLTSERLDHILKHPEMEVFHESLSEVLLKPERVVRSRVDDSVRLFYSRRNSAVFGEKWLCVVEKIS